MAATKWCKTSGGGGRRDREDRKPAKAWLKKNKNKTKAKTKRSSDAAAAAANNNNSCWTDAGGGGGSGSGGRDVMRPPTRPLKLTCCFWPRRRNNEVSPEPMPTVADDRDSVDEPRQLQPRSRFTSPSPSPAPPAVRPESPTPTPSPSDQPDDRLSPRPDTGSGGVNAEEKAAETDVPADELIVEQEERVSSPPQTDGPAVEAVKTSPPLRLTNTRRRGGRSTGDPPLTGDSDVAPLDDPKDALTRCLSQMDNPEWEVTVRGLQTLIRLCCHHSSHLAPHSQHVIQAVTRLVRSLRSQVARVASKAATHMFSSTGRSIENIRETEELCSVLLNRTADTNKFLRADCNAALDAMVDRFAAPRAVAIIVTKGARHQHAVVRAACCRLLLRVCERLGAQRALSMPRDARDAVLNAVARGLTEGSLDTRRYSKELVVLLSADARLEAMFKEAVPATVMRSIAKALTRLIAAR